MFRKTLRVIAIVALSALSQGSAAQTRAHSGTLVVVADRDKPLTLTLSDLAVMPRMKITVTLPDGRGVVHEGVLVAELLKRAGAPLGKALRGDAMASYVVASATDGYRVVFSLAELDPEFTGSEIIVADRANGDRLLPDQGPIRIIAPKDVPGARSMRMLERIELVQLPKP